MSTVARIRSFVFLLSLLLFASASSQAAVDLQKVDKTLENQPFLQIAFRQILKNPALASILIRNLEEADKSPIGAEYPEKTAILGMAMDSGTRRVAVESIVAAKRRASQVFYARLLKASKAIDQAEGEGKTIVNSIDIPAQAFDVLITGGTGVAGAQIVTTLEKVNPYLKAVIVGDENSFGGTFDSVMFFMNTANKPSSNGQLPRFREQNDNEIIGGRIQIPLIDDFAYPVARSASNVIKIILGLANTPAIFGLTNTNVEAREKVDPRASNGTDWPTRYRTTFTDAQGNKIYIFNRVGLTAAGLGEPNIPTKAPEGAKTVKEEYEKFKSNPAYNGPILNFKVMSKRIDAMNDPMKLYVDKTVILSGESVASRDVALWLMRYGPVQSYKKSTAQTGRYKKIILLGWDKIQQEDFIEFIKKNRLFYATIAKGLKNGSIIFAGKYRAEDVKINRDSSGNVQSVDVFARLKGAPTDTPLEKFSGDIVFFGTGYVDVSEKVFKKLVDAKLLVDEKGKAVPLMFSSAVKPILASADTVINAEGATTQDVAIARQIVGHEQFFLGAMAKLVGDGEVPNSSAGSPLWKDNLPRIQEFITSYFSDTESAGFETLEDPLHEPLLAIFKKDLARQFPLNDIRDAIAGADETYLKSRLEMALWSSRQNTGSFEIVITRNSDGTFALNSSSTNQTLPFQLVAELSGDPEFAEALAANIGAVSGSPFLNDTVRFSVNNGTVSSALFSSSAVFQPSAVTALPNGASANGPSASTVDDQVFQELAKGTASKEVFEKFYSTKNGWQPVRTEEWNSHGQYATEKLEQLSAALLLSDHSIVRGTIVKVAFSKSRSTFSLLVTVQLESGATETIDSDTINGLSIFKGEPMAPEKFLEKYKTWTELPTDNIKAAYTLKGKRVALRVTSQSRFGISGVVSGFVQGFQDNSGSLVEPKNGLEQRFFEGLLGGSIVLRVDDRESFGCLTALTGKLPEKGAKKMEVVVKLSDIKMARVFGSTKQMTSQEFEKRFSNWLVTSVQNHAMLSSPAIVGKKVAMFLRANPERLLPASMVQGTFLKRNELNVRTGPGSKADTKFVRTIEVDTGVEGIRQIPEEDVAVVRIEPSAFSGRLRR